MPATTLLRDLVVLVAIAIPVVAVALRFRIPTIVGFLLVGVAIGPNALALIGNVASVRGLAEIGVVLLMFEIGLELSLSRVLRLGRALLQGGAVQVGGTIVAVAAIALVAGEPLDRSLLYGSLLALSSTAIVLKIYDERGALDGPDGRVVIPIALFQDLCIIPLVLLINFLSGRTASAWQAALAIGVSLVVVGAIVVGGRLVLPRLLAHVARAKSRELFTLTIIFLGIAAAFLTEHFGLSLALGAFLAGLVIAESDYGAQALSDVLPFRDALSGIFFASVGMLLDVRFVLGAPALVLGTAGGVLVVKSAVAAGAARTLGRPFTVCVVSGLGLAQVGELSFILATLALPSGLLGPDAYQLFLAASVLTMLATPFVIARAPALADAFGRVLGRAPEPPPSGDAGEPDALRDHVIIVGYGINGRNLARVLDGAGVPYVILEQNVETIRRAREDLQPILYGDATRAALLRRVGVERARVIVFAIASPTDELRGVTAARGLSPTIHIIVRTRYVGAMADLRRAGANEVVPEEFQTSLEIFSRVLRHYEVPSNVIAREVAAARVELYGQALGVCPGDSQLEALSRLGIHHALEIVEVEPEARAVGGDSVTLNLRHATGATMVVVVRDEQVISAPGPGFRFEIGDIVLLAGEDAALARARALFVRPPPPSPHAPT